MAHFEWSADLETGQADIDDQHRHLFELANKLQDAALAADQDAEDTVEDTIYELTDYVVQHFNDEEELMTEHGYPSLSSHRALHEHLTAETMMLAASYFNGEKVAATKIAPFLAKWLQGHIREEDVRFVELMHRDRNNDRRMIVMSTTEPRFKKLRIYNLVMGLFHFGQGVAILALANDFTLPITASFIKGPPGTPPGAPETLFDFPLGLGVAAFVFLSALAHFIIVSPGVFPWYVANLKKNRNYARWIEYSLSSSLMVVLIALLPGIFDASALIAIFGVNASMILFGLLFEHYEEPGRPNWLSFIFGCLTGIVPWLAIGLYMWSPGSTAEPPGFVYAIFITMFVFFNSFAINQVLQYKQIGKWKDYLFGEFVYVFLSLSAKSLLAWLVFANTLIPS